MDVNCKGRTLFNYYQCSIMINFLIKKICCWSEVRLLSLHNNQWFNWVVPLESLGSVNPSVSLLMVQMVPLVPITGTIEWKFVGSRSYNRFANKSS